MIEIKFDKDTLPKDGQKVKFILFDKEDEKLIGEYIADETMFYISSSQFYYPHEVDQWEPITEDSDPITIETKIKELVEATLRIGAARGAKEHIGYDKEFELIKNHIPSLTKRFMQIIRKAIK